MANRQTYDPGYFDDGSAAPIYGPPRPLTPIGPVAGPRQRPAAVPVPVVPRVPTPRPEPAPLAMRGSVPITANPKKPAAYPKRATPQEKNRISVQKQYDKLPPMDEVMAGLQDDQDWLDASPEDQKAFIRLYHDKVTRNQTWFESGDEDVQAARESHIQQRPVGEIREEQNLFPEPEYTQPGGFGRSMNLIASGIDQGPVGGAYSVATGGKRMMPNMETRSNYEGFLRTGLGTIGSTLGLGYGAAMAAPAVLPAAATTAIGVGGVNAVSALATTLAASFPTIAGQLARGEISAKQAAWMAGIDLGTGQAFGPIAGRFPGLGAPETILRTGAQSAVSQAGELAKGNGMTLESGGMDLAMNLAQELAGRGRAKAQIKQKVDADIRSMDPDVVAAREADGETLSQHVNDLLAPSIHPGTEQAAAAAGGRRAAIRAERAAAEARRAAQQKIIDDRIANGATPEQVRAQRDPIPADAAQADAAARPLGRRGTTTYDANLRPDAGEYPESIYAQRPGAGEPVQDQAVIAPGAKPIVTDEGGLGDVTGGRLIDKTGQGPVDVSRITETDLTDLGRLPGPKKPPVFEPTEAEIAAAGRPAPTRPPVVSDETVSDLQESPNSVRGFAGGDQLRVSKTGAHIDVTGFTGDHRIKLRDESIGDSTVDAKTLQRMARSGDLDVNRPLSRPEPPKETPKLFEPEAPPAKPEGPKQLTEGKTVYSEAPTTQRDLIREHRERIAGHVENRRQLLESVEQAKTGLGKGKKTRKAGDAEREATIAELEKKIRHEDEQIAFLGRMTRADYGKRPVETEAPPAKPAEPKQLAAGKTIYGEPPADKVRPTRAPISQREAARAHRARIDALVVTEKAKLAEIESVRSAMKKPADEGGIGKSTGRDRILALRRELAKTQEQITFLGRMTRSDYGKPDPTAGTPHLDPKIELAELRKEAVERRDIAERMLSEAHEEGAETRSGRSIETMSFEHLRISGAAKLREWAGDMAPGDVQDRFHTAAEQLIAARKEIDYLDGPTAAQDIRDRNHADTEAQKAEATKKAEAAKNVEDGKLDFDGDDIPAFDDPKFSKPGKKENQRGSMGTTAKAPTTDEATGAVLFGAAMIKRGSPDKKAFVEGITVKWGRHMKAHANDLWEKAARLHQGMNDSLGKKANETIYGADANDPRKMARNIVERGVQRVPSPKAEATATNVREAIETQAPVPIEKYLAKNINQARLETTDDVRRAIDEVGKTYAHEIDDARRGTITNEQTQEMADLLGMSVKELGKRKVGQAYNAAQLKAARDLLMASGDALTTQAKKVNGGANSDADLLELGQALELHKALQAQVSGAIAEAGRALQSMNMMAKSRKANHAEIKKILDEMGGGDLRKMAKMLGEVPDMNKFVADIRRGNPLIEAWINNVLSGPRTHMANITGNSLVLVGKFGENAMTALISGGRHRNAGEVKAELFGMVQGVREGIVAAKQTWKTGESRFGNPLESTTHGSATGEYLAGKGARSDVATAAGRAVTSSGRALQAEDDFFKSIHYRMEVNRLSYQQARAEGLTGTAMKKRITELAADTEIHDKSTAEALYRTFNKKLEDTDPLSSAGKWIMKARSNYPGLTLLIPFVRTPVNITKYAGERSPFAMLSKAVRTEVAAGGERRAVALGKMAFGSGVMLAVGAGVAAGTITGGGPTDRTEREALYRTGWQPYSLKMGDTYVSYNRLAPYGQIAAIAADIAEIGGKAHQRTVADSASAVAWSFFKNLSSATYLQGVTDLVNAAQDPDRYGAKVLMNVGSGFVPAGGLATNINDMIDPELRRIEEVLDAVRGKTVGGRNKMNPKVDAFGETPEREAYGPGAAIFRAVSPMMISRDKNDPAANELVRLGIELSAPGKSHRGALLDPEDWTEHAQAMGKEIHESITNVVSRPGWDGMDEDRQRQLIESRISKVKSKHREALTKKLAVSH